MKNSKNYNMDLPEIHEQYNIKHMNKNTEIIDAEMKKFQDLFDNLYKNVYPVGCLYWSSKPTDPKELFPGTIWKQITDKFIFAQGSKAVDTEGGAETITLSVAQLPSHSHTISHTHTYTPSGTVSSHSHGIDFTSGASSKSSTGGNGEHSHSGNTLNATGYIDTPIAAKVTGVFSEGSQVGYEVEGGSGGVFQHSYFSTSGKWSGSTSSVGNHTHDMTHTHSIKGNTSSVIPKFTGSLGTTNNSSNANSGSTGSGSAINIMPPYVVKYCWERIS